MARWHAVVSALGLLLIIHTVAAAEADTIELKTTTIKGNKELPRIIYVVPWKDIKQEKQEDYKIELHSLFGNLFDPVLPQHAASR